MTTEYTIKPRSRIEPPITLSADDYQRLSALAHLVKNSLPDRAADLAEEIERAQKRGNVVFGVGGRMAVRQHELGEHLPIRL